MKKLEQAQKPLYAIAVPGDAIEFEPDLLPDEKLGSLMYIINGKENYESVGFDFEIVGTATKDDIDFDVLPFIEGQKDCEGAYRDYTGDFWCCVKPTTSFRSLLTANGIDFNDEQKLVFIKPV